MTDSKTPPKTTSKTPSKTDSETSSKTESKFDSRLKYDDLLEKLDRLDLKKPREVKLLGYGSVRSQIQDQINTFRNFVVSGPSGVGKTTIIEQIARNHEFLNSSKKMEKSIFMYFDASWFASKSQFGDPDVQLGEVFKEAIEKAPTIIFIDDADCICGKKRNQTELDRRIIGKLKNQLAKIARVNSQVIVILATMQPDSLDPDIIKFFEDEIKIPLPNRADRIKKLKSLFPNFTEQQLESIADVTNCYMFKDLDILSYRSRKKKYDSVTDTLKTFKPKTIRDFISPYNPIRWNEIGGVANVKADLIRYVIKPLQDKNKFEYYCRNRSRGCLLYGPPGCSKTMLAQALATESGYNFKSIKGPELFRKYVGDSEANVRRLYSEAREIAPCIIFFDEIDGFATNRNDSQGSSVSEKVVTQLLTEFNGPSDGVFTIAATNRPDRVDCALLRPGRLDSLIYIPLPSLSDRAEIFRVHMRGLPVKFDKLDEEVLREMAERTEGFSGADIAKVCHVAGINAWIESDNSDALDPITWRHFEEALRNVKPSVKPKDIKPYEEFYEQGLKAGQRESLAGHSFRRKEYPARNELCDEFNDTLDLDKR